MSAGLWSLDPNFRPYAKLLIDALTALGLEPRVTSTYRSLGTQSRLYQAFLAGKSPYPAAPPGGSQHNYRLAFDLVIRDMSLMPQVGAAWKSFGPGFRWGGDFKDPVHFDYKP